MHHEKITSRRLITAPVMRSDLFLVQCFGTCISSVFMEDTHRNTTNTCRYCHHRRAPQTKYLQDSTRECTMLHVCYKYVRLRGLTYIHTCRSIVPTPRRSQPLPFGSQTPHDRQPKGNRCERQGRGGALADFGLPVKQSSQKYSLPWTPMNCRANYILSPNIDQTGS